MSVASTIVAPRIAQVLRNAGFSLARSKGSLRALQEVQDCRSNANFQAAMQLVADAQAKLNVAIGELTGDPDQHSS